MKKTYNYFLLLLIWITETGIFDDEDLTLPLRGVGIMSQILTAVLFSDKTHQGRSKLVVVSENMELFKKIILVQKLIKQDHHVIYYEIEVVLDINSTSIHKIFHKNLAVKKV